MTRHKWLVQLTDKLKPLFRDVGCPIPECMLDTALLEGIYTAVFSEGSWFITISTCINDEIKVAEALIGSLIQVTTAETRDTLSTLIGYRSEQSDGNKLAFCLKRLVTRMPSYPPQLTRKAWLTCLVEELRPLFEDTQYPLPTEIQASPGWSCPGYPKHGMYQQVTGECFIFVWPQVSGSLDVAIQLVNELPRCAVDIFGPKEIINKVARQIGLGLDGVPNTLLKFLLKNIIDDIGEYPGS